MRFGIFCFLGNQAEDKCSFLEDVRLMINFVLFPIGRKFTKLVGSEKRLRVAPVKAAYSGEFWAPDKNSRQGIWSIR